MSSFLYAEWTVLTADTPLIIRRCSRCSRARSFASTGKFRLNANGNRLDAWLIYRCFSCQNRWNRTLFERRPLHNVAKDLLASLQSNDAELARRIASMPVSNAEAGFPGAGVSFTLSKRLLGSPNDCVAVSSLTILNPGGSNVRLDRVLADGLSLSRRALQDLVDEGAFRVSSGSRKALKRALKARTVLEISARAHAGLPDLNMRLFDQPQILP